ncbi:hypothetical protein JY409_09315 [Stenotrophomonas maltophilia]|nr:hypothetical protein [Stenotrophomonas maltophilia]
MSNTTARAHGRQMKNAGRIDANADMHDLIRTLNQRDAEISEFAEKAVQSVKEHDARLLDVEQKLARRAGCGNAVEDQAGLEQAYKGLVQSDGLKAMREEGATSTGRIVLDVGLKALTSLQGSGSRQVQQNITINGDPSTRDLERYKAAMREGADLAYARVQNDIATGTGIGKTLRTSNNVGRRLR